MRKEVKNWWDQAKRDLETAQSNFENNHLDAAAFFCQQSVEKALKALLIKKKGEFPKIHDLVALSRISECSEEIINKCKKISPYYTETRYPDFLEKIPAESFSKNEISEILSLAKEVLKWLEKYLT